MKSITPLIVVFVVLIIFFVCIGIGILIHRSRHLKRCTAIKQVHIVKIHWLYNPPKASVSDGKTISKIQLPEIAGLHFRLDLSRYNHLCNRPLDVLYNPSRPSEMRFPETRYTNLLFCGIGCIATSVFTMLIFLFILIILLT